MKIRSAPLDDTHNELVFVLTDDGRPIARFVLSLCRLAYRLHRATLLTILRRKWSYAIRPVLGYEPFNLSPEEMRAAQEEAATKI